MATLGFVSLLAGVAAVTGAATPPGQVVACPPAYRSFIKALTVLEGHLDVSVDYNAYEGYLARVQIAYNQVPVTHASVACLTDIGVPGEHAMNDFALAGNSWTACINRASAGAAASCTAVGSPGEGTRQAYWRQARAAVQRAVNSLG